MSGLFGGPYQRYVNCDRTRLSCQVVLGSCILRPVLAFASRDISEGEPVTEYQAMTRYLIALALVLYTRLMREAEEEATLKISRAHREASVPL